MKPYVGIKEIIVINGPNINVIGLREPKVYGEMLLKDMVKDIRKESVGLNVRLRFFQSNSEYKIVKLLQQVRRQNKVMGIVINPAAYSYYSVPILDAILYTEVPFVEVHISNIYKRAPFRQYSLFSKYARCVIIGAKQWGYIFAVKVLANS